MKLKLASLFLLFIMIFSCFGCGEAKEVVIDPSVLSSALSEVYLGGLNEVIELDAETGKIRYGIDGLYTYLYCCASVTVASDEFAVIEAKDEEAAESIYTIMDSYRKDRIELFASYAAGEVPKLENAFLRRAGKYVVFVASDDISEAKRIFNEAKG